ncbi:MAG TPA: CCA tRNA nucleotidyltransferase [Chitinivibrionales bacterium]|nr:CCA tRNA nucleotidyltransferase [Chitinivibrionales bacterium]
MKTPKEAAALEIVKLLADHGHRALYAGGYVRDMVMGLPTKGDIDIATSATPEVVCKLFPHVVTVGEHFGVVIVNHNEMPFEVATFRKDVGIGDGRHPASVTFSDEKEDALRRDFTINGMFYDPLSDKVLDYVRGGEDISKGIIRAIGEARLRFNEDYLRMIRAIRFSARFGFAIEKETWAALKEKAEGILQISAERVFQELDKILAEPSSGKAMTMLHESGLLTRILPEVEKTVGVGQPQQFHPEGDVFTHTVTALSLLVNPTQVAAWSTLLHDIGKPPTMEVSDRIRFSNHDNVGAGMAAGLLRRLKAPSALIESVCDVIANHMNFINVRKMRLSTLKRFLARPTLADELEVHRVDCLASHGDISNYTFIKEKQAEMPVEEIKPKALINGKDLIELGYKPGPIFGKILGEAYDLQLENKLQTRDEAIEWVKNSLKKE